MAGRRKTIASKGGKRYVRRAKGGQFTNDQVNVGKSLAADRRRKAKAVAKPGYGDQGDRAARTGPTRATKSQASTRKRTS